MRRYQLSGVEHIHMMRRVPRSYDMTRTHILHKGVNKHVDVVLKCSPKNWKKKKVQVCLVRSPKKTEAAQIRANARKGYVAVRKPLRSESYESERKAAARAVSPSYETSYGRPTANDSTLIHDMNSQLAAMAQKSAKYIDRQLTPEKPERPAPPVQTAAPLPQTAPAAAPAPAEPPAAPLISPETDDILKKGGYRLRKPAADSEAYAADYSTHASTEEFHDLMASLEKSLDEACSKYVTEPAGESAPEPDGKADLPQSAYNVNAGSQEIDPAVPPAPADDTPEFKPALTFADGGEHFVPEDELFRRDLTHSEDDFPLPPVKKTEEPFDPARFFDDEPDTAADAPGGESLPSTPFPDEEDAPSMPFPDEEDAPSMPFPDEEDAPPILFPDDDDDNGYSPAPVSPDRNEGYGSDSFSVTQHSDETLLSRTGGQIKKVIGIIRGSASSLLHPAADDEIVNENVEIRFSDH